MHLWYCTYLLKKSVYKWTLDSSNLYRSRVICNYFEENKALAPRSPHQRRGVWSGPSGIRSVLEGKIGSSCGWGSPELYFPLCNLGQGTFCLHGPPTCPCYVTPSTLFSEYFLSVA